MRWPTQLGFVFALLSIEACGASGGQAQSTPVVVAVERASSPRDARDPPLASDGHEVVAAEAYSIGGWHLGQPMGVLARARPDIWKMRAVDVGGGDLTAMTIGRRHPDASDPLGGSHLTFIGPRPHVTDRSKENAEDVFAPNLTIALGDTAMELFTPRLPSISAAPQLGTVSFTVDIPLRDSKQEQDLRDIRERSSDPMIDESQRTKILDDLHKQQSAPKTLRIEQHASRVAVVLGEGRLLGYVLGDVPREPANRFYSGLQRLVQAHLGLR